MILYISHLKFYTLRDAADQGRGRFRSLVLQVLGQSSGASIAGNVLECRFSGLGPDLVNQKLRAGPREPV